MKAQHSIFAGLLYLFIFAFLNISTDAQSIGPSATYYPDLNNPGGQIQLRSTIKVIQRILLITNTQVDDITDLIVHNNSTVVLVINLQSPLSCTLKKKDGGIISAPCKPKPAEGDSLVLEGHNLLITYRNETGKSLSRMVGIIRNNAPATLHTLEDVKADSDEDADYYISGNITGAHKKKTAFTTEIKIQPYQRGYFQNKLIFTPVYFKLNASTAADADPDNMEIGFKLRNVFNKKFAGFSGAFLDNGVKIESERDFDNTNLIAETRLIFLPPALNKRTFQIYLNPFIGAELGKNLRSPLNAAEGDSITRFLAGADLRVTFFKGEDTPWANWTTSYTRRWLLSNELRFRTDSDNNLVLVESGKRPRDYFESKFSFKVGSFTDAFIAYDWGETPPSYKKLDHRFRLGFEFRKKTVF
jgi:hypothetical protein